MLIDLHVTPHEISPTALAQAAREAGLHGVVVTDTNRTDRLPAYLDALRAAGLAAYGGVELALVRGFLVLIPSQLNASFLGTTWSPSTGRWTAQDALAAAKAVPGAIIAGHPYCRDLESVLFDTVFTLDGLNGVETRVGRGRPLWDSMADGVAERKTLSHIGSSGGDPAFIGRAMTYVHGERLTQADVVTAIKDQLVWPIEMEARGQSRPREEEYVEPPRRSDDEAGEGGGEGGERPRTDDRGERPRRDDRGGRPGGRGGRDDRGGRSGGGDRGGPRRRRD